MMLAYKSHVLCWINESFAISWSFFARQESSSEASEREENEEEFLERYAETARELQEEAKEEAENGQDEDGHEIELGMQLDHVNSLSFYT